MVVQYGTQNKKASGIPEALIFLAGVRGNRTHPGQEHCPATGFEDQEHHQAPSTPVKLA